MTGYKIANELIRCYDGEPWHGPNLKTILAGLTPASAAARPIAGAHSAWEILMHIDAWHHVILKRLDGEVCKEPPEDFPQPEAVTGDTWQAALASFEKTLHLLADRIRAAGDRDAVKLNGVVHHLIYHSGQIAVLAKA